MSFAMSPPELAATIEFSSVKGKGFPRPKAMVSPVPLEFPERVELMISIRFPSEQMPAPPKAAELPETVEFRR